MVGIEHFLFGDGPFSGSMLVLGWVFVFPSILYNYTASPTENGDFPLLLLV